MSLPVLPPLLLGAMLQVSPLCDLRVGVSSASQLISVKFVNEKPCIVVSFSVQQVYCLWDREGNVLEGAPVCPFSSWGSPIVLPPTKNNTNQWMGTLSLPQPRRTTCDAMFLWWLCNNSWMKRQGRSSCRSLNGASSNSTSRSPLLCWYEVRCCNPHNPCLPHTHPH